MQGDGTDKEPSPLLCLITRGQDWADGHGLPPCCVGPVSGQRDRVSALGISGESGQAASPMPTAGPRGRRADREGLGRRAHSPPELLPAPGQVLGLVPHQVQDRAGHLLLKGASVPANAQAAEGGWGDAVVDGGPSGPACPPHHTHGPASRSPPLAVEVLGPVGDVAVPVLLPGLLPPPLGSLARSWLSPLPAHDLCEGVLTDGGPVTPQPLGVYLPPTPPRLELKAGGSGTLNTWCCHLDPVSASAHTARPHLRPRGGGQDRCWVLGWHPGTNPQLRLPGCVTKARPCPSLGLALLRTAGTTPGVFNAVFWPWDPVSKSDVRGMA